MTQRRRVLAALLGSAFVVAAPRVHARAWQAAPAFAPVSLRDHEGSAHDLHTVMRGRPVAINFFYTGCSTVCPPQTALLLEASRHWRTHTALRNALVVSISVDPLADGPAQLQAYGRRHGLPLGAKQGWILLTGTPPEIGRVLAAFDVATRSAEQHPSLLWLADEPRGRWTRTSALNAPAQITALFEALHQ